MTLATSLPLDEDALWGGLRDCAICGIAFRPDRTGRPAKRRRQQCCSNRCKWQAQVGLPPNALPGRICDSCGEVYVGASGNQRWCQTCCPDKTARMRLVRYNVSQPQWDSMVARYDGMCWICRTRPAIFLDHDHATGLARGPLCAWCNNHLSIVDDPDWLEAARLYLIEAQDASQTAPSGTLTDFQPDPVP